MSMSTVIKTGGGGPNLSSNLRSWPFQPCRHPWVYSLESLRSRRWSGSAPRWGSQTLSCESEGRVSDATTRTQFPFRSHHYRQQSFVLEGNVPLGAPTRRCYTGSNFILVRSASIFSGSRHCLVLQPALMFKMEFLQILQRDVLLLFSASQAQAFKAIL